MFTVVKRGLWLACLLVVLALVLSTNYVLGRLATAQLSGLVSAALHRPVSVGEVEVDLLQLRASSRRILVGTEEQPGLSLDDVQVELDFGALLTGSLHFAAVSGRYMSVDVGYFRGDGNGKPVNRDVINRWLPESIELGTLALFNGEQRLSLTKENHWLRVPGEAQLLSWRQAGLESELAVRLEFSSIFRLLDEQHGEVRVEVVPAAAPDEMLSAEIRVEPVAQGIHQALQLESGAIAGSWQFVTPELFMWPQVSQLELEYLDLDRVFELVALLSDASQKQSVDRLQGPLPELSLPEHEVDMTVAELNLDDELISNLRAVVAMQSGDVNQASSFQVNGLKARLPLSNLSGAIAVEPGEIWNVGIELVLDTEGRASTIAANYEDSDWLWQTGRAEFNASGATIMELLESARGRASAGGIYEAAEQLPLSLSAEFNSERGLLGADNLALQIGDSKFFGSVWTDDSQRALKAKLSSPYLDITQLAGDQASEADVSPGLDVPDLSWIPSDVEIDVQFEGAAVALAERRFDDVNLAFTHNAEEVALDLALSTSKIGRLNLHATAQRDRTDRALQFEIEVDDIDAQSFGMDVPVVLTAGRLEMSGRGTSLPEIVPNLVGDLSMQLASKDGAHTVSVGVSPSFVSENNRVVAILLDGLALKLDEASSSNAKLRINLKDKSITGELSTDILDLDDLVAGDDQDSVPTAIAAQLSGLPSLDLQLRVKDLTLQKQSLTNIELGLKTGDGSVHVTGMSFDSDFGQVRGQGDLLAVGEDTQLLVEGTLHGLEVSALTELQIAKQLNSPLTGTFKVASSGSQWGSLVERASLRLTLEEQIDLANTESEFDIDVTLERHSGTYVADIHQMHWRANDAQGKLEFRNLDPPEIRMQMTATSLDLTPFETSSGNRGTDTIEQRGLVRSITQVTQQSLGFLASSVREGAASLVPSSDSTTDTFFSRAPWPATILDTVVADIKVEAAQIKTRRGISYDTNIDAVIRDRTLDVSIASREINGGPLALSLVYDSAQTPAHGKMQATLVGVRPRDVAGLAPVSLFLNLEGRGDNEADLMASIVGQMYVTADTGSADYASLGGGFLTGDLVQSVMRKLLPLAKDTAPYLECAVAYGEMRSGKFETPGALVLRTRNANILVRLQADFAAETVSAQFDSRSHSGTGLSVGNVLSDTVMLEGSLLAPKVVANRRNMLWKYGAAVASGGLTLIGESVYKRLMADSNPCGRMRDEIQALVCTTESPAAASSLVCPGVSST